MSSSLFNAMSHGNNSMLIDSMLNGLKVANPTAYNQLQGILQSGGTEQAIANMMKQLNPQQVGQFRSMATMLGLDVNKYVK